METIFIQIASYRDPQLLPTIDDCLLHASNPQRLRFGICNQTDNLTELDKHSDDDRFRIIGVPYEESKGVCWARHLIQARCYDNETYTLQMDSHHRFVKGWDEKLVSMFKRLQSRGHRKPLLTTYAPSFSPSDDPGERRQEIWLMSFDRFIPEGAIFFMPTVATDPAELKEPVPARFYSAHFAFTLGQMCREVPHDPNYYFHGEEMSIAVRAYTHGYDLFHPNEVILWHEYSRARRVKHWDDHSNCVEANKAAHKRNRILFGMEANTGDVDFGEYGFGTDRTLADYEQYAGIRFRDRSVQQYTLQNKRPPNPADQEWFCEFKYSIKIPKNMLLETDYEFWAVGFHDALGKTLYRQDSKRNEIEQLLSTTDSDMISIERRFATKTLPVRWLVRPYSASKGWCDLLYGLICNE